MSYQYQRVADDLRDRLATAEWPVGAQIPTISELQEHYGIQALGTIRQAQAVLMEEGLLRAEQGRGVFVVAHPGVIPAEQRRLAALEAIDEAIRLLDDARRSLAAA